MYTPQAPDGRVFHEYAKDRLMSDFIINSSWRAYLLGRVERAFEPHVRAVLRGRGDVSMVSLSRIADDFFEEAYEAEANCVINDAAAQAKSTRQVDIETGLNVATVAFDVLSMVLPVRIMLPIGLARSLFSVFNAVEALDLGDRAGAAQSFVRSLGELVGALVDGAVGARAPVAGSRPRALPAEMALGKSPTAWRRWPDGKARACITRPRTPRVPSTTSSMTVGVGTRSSMTATKPPGGSGTHAS